MAIYLGDTLLTGPSGGTAASLTADQTFTGANTFSETAVFSKDLDADGSIQIADSITHQGDTGTYLSFGTALVQLRAQAGLDSNIVRVYEDMTEFNPQYRDVDFIVRSDASHDAINYNAGTDTLLSEATNFTGIADQETGTWTPTGTNTGVIQTITATYSRVGKTVTILLHLQTNTTTTSTDIVRIGGLPFDIASSTTFGMGYFSYNAIDGMVRHSTSAVNSINFQKSDDTAFIGTDITSGGSAWRTSFTYITD